MIDIYYGNNRCANRAAKLFNEQHENNVSRQYVSNLGAKFQETESVALANKKRYVELPISNETIEVAILDHVSLDPTLITRKLATVSDVSRTSIQHILKTHKFHPYKISLTHELILIGYSLSARQKKAK